MRTRQTVPAPTDVELVPLEYSCTACGVNGPVALIAYPYGGGEPRVLCAACARDEAHLREMVRALTSCPLAETAVSHVA